VFGRYVGGGDAEVTARGSVNGVEFKQSAKLQFPKSDPANPEIDRMWAWHRIDNLLKQADRNGSRNDVIPEVIKLGEGHSIVTEYTSFIVLENDAEFQRWKIARNNAIRSDRDRKAQELARSNLEKIRNKAIAGLGPQPEVQLASLQPMVPSRAGRPPSASAPAPAPASQSSASAPEPRSRRSFDFGGGSGPVGPLFLGLLLALKRLKSKRS
jgi:Ca-activated chloride channel family protein